MEHKHFSPEEKMMYINKYYASKKNIYNFCKDENISRSTFYTWLKIYEISLPHQQLFEPITSIVKKKLIMKKDH